MHIKEPNYDTFEFEILKYDYSMNKCCCNYSECYIWQEFYYNQFSTKMPKLAVILKLCKLKTQIKAYECKH